MSKIFTVMMPDIGEGVVEGEIISWLKQPGDTIKQDEHIVVVMTDKATVELPAPYPGRLAKQHYKVGEIAIKDKPLYEIEIAEEQNVPTNSLEKASTEIIPSSEVSKTHHKILASPKTRKLAKDLQVDLTKIKPTGEGGIVTSEDLMNHLNEIKKGSDSLSGDTVEPLVGIRSLMAKKMTLAKNEIPQFSYCEEVDCTRLVQLKEKFKESASKQQVHVTYLPFIIKALSLTLQKYPLANSSVDKSNHSVVYHSQHNVGIAMASSYGLIVPVLKNVQQLNLEQIILQLEDLKAKAASSQLAVEDMKNATISITNYGALGSGGVWATPIINFPEVAILGISRIHKMPVVRNDNIVIREIINLSWSFDHRVIDGEIAAAISHHLASLLQNPAALL